MTRKKPKDEKYTHPLANPNTLLVQMHSLEASKKFEDLLRDAEGEIIDQLRRATRQLLITFWINVAIHGVGFLLAVILVIMGILVFFNQNFGSSERNFGVAISWISLFLLALILLRNPLKNYNRLVNDLAKTQIIFLGYVRQINHIDTAYKKIIWGTETDSSRETKAMLLKIQEVVEQSIDELMRSVEEMG